MYYEKLQELYNQIDVSELQTIDVNSSSIFEGLLRVAFCKCIQLNQMIHESINNDNSFLYLPNIRGICEEIIVLKFIDDLISDSDKDILLLSMSKLTIAKELREQELFIRKYRPAQPVLKEDFANNFKGEEISEVLNRNGINGNKMPPTAQMADRIGLKELYDYLYRGSCSFVHFNPRIMQRTIWAEKNSTKVYKTSITNFHKYYFSFSSFYCSYLLVLLYKYFGHYFHLSTEHVKIFVEIKEFIRRTRHYPELVTFEEVDLKRPKT